jgi:polar amino acid transport system substrate-binding protein
MNWILRLMALIFASFLMACPAYGETMPDVINPPDIQRILDRGKLIVSILNQDNTPFFSSSPTDLHGQTDQYKGLDIEMAEAIASHLGVQLELNATATTFDEAVNTVYRQEADLAISKVSRTMKRATRVRFSRPYVTMRQGLLVNRVQLAQQAEGREMVEVIRQLKGTIGVIQGSSYVGFAKQKFPQATVQEFATWSALVNAVMRGQVLAAYRDEVEIKKIVRNQPQSALQFQTIALTDTEDAIAMALPWNSEHLLGFVNQYLDMSKINYTADTLLDAYGNSAKPA